MEKIYYGEDEKNDDCETQACCSINESPENKFVDATIKIFMNKTGFPCGLYTKEHLLIRDMLRTALEKELKDLIDQYNNIKAEECMDFYKRISKDRILPMPITDKTFKIKPHLDVKYKCDNFVEALINSLPKKEETGGKNDNRK